MKVGNVVIINDKFETVFTGKKGIVKAIDVDEVLIEFKSMSLWLDECYLDVIKF